MVIMEICVPYSMLSVILLTLFSLLFTLVTWFRFNWGLFLLFLLLPTYLIRFHVFGIPTTLLEIMIGIIVIVWAVKETRYKTSTYAKATADKQDTNNIQYSIFNIQYFYSHYRLLFFSAILFLAGATISVFTSVDVRAAAGEWKAFYFEPVVIFFILVSSFQKYSHDPTSDFRFQISDFRLKKRQEPKKSPISNLQSLIIFALALSGLATSILAIYQHFTGFFVPYAFWENQNTYRVTAWYGYPNAVGLFLAPKNSFFT